MTAKEKILEARRLLREAAVEIWRDEPLDKVGSMRHVIDTLLGAENSINQLLLHKHEISNP